MKNVDVIDESTFILVAANNTFKTDNFDLITHTCAVQIRKSDEIVQFDEIVRFLDYLQR